MNYSFKRSATIAHGMLANLMQNDFSPVKI